VLPSSLFSTPHLTSNNPTARKERRGGGGEGPSATRRVTSCFVLYLESYPRDLDGRREGKGKERKEGNLRRETAPACSTPCCLRGFDQRGEGGGKKERRKTAAGVRGSLSLSSATLRLEKEGGKEKRKEGGERLSCRPRPTEYPCYSSCCTNSGGKK